MWTEEHRRIYRREGKGYPSDLRDAEWARLEPMIPPARPGGRPRKTDMRAAMNAILYLLRTGCPWALPAARRVSATLVVDSAAIQDRDGAGLVPDKIRRRFPWLEVPDLYIAGRGDGAQSR